MNMYAKRGDKVVYCYTENGYEHDRKECEKHLELEKIYTVYATVVYDWSSTVEFEEIPGVKFNTVMFRDV